MKDSHIKFHGNPYSGTRAGTRGQTEGGTRRYCATPHLQNCSMETDSVLPLIRLVHNEHR